MSRWEKIRSRLQRTAEADGLYDAVVLVGKLKAEEIPDDIARAVLSLVEHPNPETRAEAIRALGVHWRLGHATDAIEEALRRDPDSHVRLTAVTALGCLAREQPDRGSSISDCLASIVLEDQRDDYERMIAYVELQFMQGRLDFSQYSVLDRDIPEKMADFDWDQQWVESLLTSEGP